MGTSVTRSRSTTASATASNSTPRRAWRRLSARRGMSWRRSAWTPSAARALTDAIEVPKGRSADEMGHGIPITYVPARNTIFLSFALAWAEVLGTGDIFIGVNALDYSGYPDCRPEFIEAYERMANLATKAGVEGTAARPDPYAAAAAFESGDREAGRRTGRAFRPDPQLLRSRAGRPPVRTVRCLPAAAQGLRRGGH